MPKLVDSQISKTVSAQASEWFVLMVSGKASPRQRQDFVSWLAQSPAHQKAWLQTQAIWQGLEQLGLADLPEVKALPQPARPLPGRFFGPARYALGALAIVLAVWLYRQPFWYADYYTEAGASKTIALNDGSVVELATDSAISVAYTGHYRRIVLHRGEAFFTVAADAARPFDVVAGAAEIRALGTAFDVSRAGGDMQVTVFEHSVRVTAGDQRIAKLTRGNAIRFQNKRLGDVTPQPLAVIDGWRRHRLVFDDKRLDDVVKALNRYRRLPIIILGHSVKNLAVTGWFDTDNTDTALRTIEETLAVKIRRLPGGLVLLSAA